MNTVHNIDCMLGMQDLSDKSVDMILCDLPYGKTSRTKWDIILPMQELWSTYRRVIKDNGAIALTATQPFATDLINAARDIFRYDLVWHKSRSVGFLNANKQPLRSHELVLVFYKTQPTFHPQKTPGKPYTAQQGSHGKVYGNECGTPVTVNATGDRYPGSVHAFKSEGRAIHPTQKPVKLFEWLIRSYTNEGELVLDNCMGSGTTAIACINTNRQFIGYESDEHIYKQCAERISTHISGRDNGNI